MYIVRETFIAKPGHTGEFAQLMKSDMASWDDFKGHVLLDMVTDYNKIVVEYEIESLAAFEKMMTNMKKITMFIMPYLLVRVRIAGPAPCRSFARRGPHYWWRAAR